MGAPRDNFIVDCENWIYKEIKKRGAKKNCYGQIKGDVIRYSIVQVVQTDVHEYIFFHAEWFLCCRAGMKHLSAFDAFVRLWRKKSLGVEIDASRFFVETCGSGHGCSDNAITDAELVRRFGRYCIV